LAGSANLSKVIAPTLLIMGGDEESVIEMNKEAFEQLSSIKDNNKKKIVIVPGTTHLFEEPGKLEKVAELAADWFIKYLG
jgi:putative phosphoribosyl transferase